MHYFMGLKDRLVSHWLIYLPVMWWGTCQPQADLN